MNGKLAVPDPGDADHEICGGAEFGVANTNITLCMSLAFNFGLGGLEMINESVGFLGSVAFPGFALLFALPFRHYMIVVLAGLLSAISRSIQGSITHWNEDVVDSANQLLLPYYTDKIAFKALFPRVVAAYSAAATILALAMVHINEKNSRTLFEVQTVLQDKREALISKRDKQRQVQESRVCLLFFARVNDEP